MSDINELSRRLDKLESLFHATMNDHQELISATDSDLRAKLGCLVAQTFDDKTTILDLRAKNAALVDALKDLLHAATEPESERWGPIFAAQRILNEVQS